MTKSGDPRKRKENGRTTGKSPNGHRPPKKQKFNNAEKQALIEKMEEALRREMALIKEIESIIPSDSEGLKLMPINHAIRSFAKSNNLGFEQAQDLAEIALYRIFPNTTQTTFTVGQ